MRVARGVAKIADTKRGEARFQGRYFVGYSEQGKRVYRSRTFNSLEKAEQWYSRSRHDIEPSENADLALPERWVVTSYAAIKHGAAKRKLSFELTVEEYKDIIRQSAGRCALTGIRFEFQLPDTKSRRRPFAPSLDRIDCEQGYIKENCRLICTALNFALSDWGMAPLMRIARSLVAREFNLKHRSNPTKVNVRGNPHTKGTETAYLLREKRGLHRFSMCDDTFSEFEMGRIT